MSEHEEMPPGAPEFSHDMQKWAMNTLGRLMTLAKDAEAKPNDVSVMETAKVIAALSAVELVEPIVMSTEWASVILVFNGVDRNLELEFHGDESGMEFVVASFDASGVVIMDSIKVGIIGYPETEESILKLATWLDGKDFDSSLDRYLYPEDEGEACPVSENGSEPMNPE